MILATSGSGGSPELCSEEKLCECKEGRCELHEEFHHDDLVRYSYQLETIDSE
jgi:hypothetical protein